MRPAALASLAVVVALAGCGGTTPTQTEESTAIPRSVANRLAATSESVAAAWEAGDTCGAAQQADDLKHDAEDAVASGAIPAAFQDELESAVLNLQNTANCVKEGEGDEDKSKDEEKGKDEEKQEDGVTITTDTLGTTTEAGG